MKTAAILSLLSILLLGSAAHAQEWEQHVWTHEGGLLLRLTYSAASANTIYRSDGSEINPSDDPPRTVRDYPWAERSLRLQAQFAPTNLLRLALELAPKRVIVTTAEERRTVEGLGDIDLRGRYRLMHMGDHRLHGSLGLTIPTGYTRDLSPSLGPGNMRIGLAGIYEFNPGDAELSATLGYRLRPGLFISTLADSTGDLADDYSDQIFSDIQATWVFREGWLLHGAALFTFSTNASAREFNVAHTAESPSSIKLGGGLSFRVLKSVAIDAEAFYTPFGHSTVNSVDIRIGIEWWTSVFEPAGTNPLDPSNQE